MTFVPKTQGQTMQRVVEGDLATDAAFLKGSPVVQASGEYDEVGADPTSIAGIALHDVGTGSGALYPIGTKEFPPGKVLLMPVANEIPFTAEYTGTLPSALGGSYGIVKDSDDKWRVDFSDTTNVCVKLTGWGNTAAPISGGRVEVVFLASDVQIV